MASAGFQRKRLKRGNGTAEAASGGNLSWTGRIIGKLVSDSSTFIPTLSR